ncbi:hypothetical protein [Nannocystis sp. SCPEA4]|uniref:hypothetical protein n=1 Tax=Nannocystis sp. SCPEA4 TaxID=2996787 RepID=UPI00226F6201|nr:hypothetical protein [Nannocystis sp. SCPEA4]MCY1061401.1 hypothetical protein [Nannocystis sp. SCPEA4]
MSIYGPPAPPPRDLAKRASILLTRLVLGIITLGALTYCTVLAVLAFRDNNREYLAVDQAETTRLDAERRREAMRLQTADILPPIPARPDFEIPAPLQTAEPLPRPVAPTVPAASGEREPPRPVEAAELMPARPVEPERLQTAEILR